MRGENTYQWKGIIYVIRFDKASMSLWRSRFLGGGPPSANVHLISDHPPDEDGNETTEDGNETTIFQTTKHHNKNSWTLPIFIHNQATFKCFC